MALIKSLLLLIISHLCIMTMIIKEKEEKEKEALSSN
jgi:hypothetical protein